MQSAVGILGGELDTAPDSAHSNVKLTPRPTLQVLFGDWCEHAGRRADADARLRDAFDAATVQAVVSDALLEQGVKV